MRHWLVVAALVWAGPGGATGCSRQPDAAQQTAELRALRADVQGLTQTLQQHLVSVEAQLVALRAEWEATRRQAAEAEAAHASRSHTRASAKRARKTRKHSTRKPAPAPVSEQDEVRALMATVAAQLQAKADAGGTAEAHRGQAQDLLVKADRAAAQGLWERARELALEAKRLLGSPTDKSEGDTSSAAVPSDLGALLRDAEGLLPGKVHANARGLVIRLPLKAGGHIDARSLEDIGRLARAYAGMRLTIKLRQPDPSDAAAADTFSAVQRKLSHDARISKGRIGPADPLMERADTGQLIIGFVAS